MVLSKCIVCGSQKSRFIKQQEASGLLLEPNLPLNKIPILGATFLRYKMNEIVNKLLLAGDKFMPEMHLRFTYSACNLHIGLVEHSLKTKNEQKNLKKQDIQDIFIKTN